MTNWETRRATEAVWRKHVSLLKVGALAALFLFCFVFGTVMLVHQNNTRESECVAMGGEYHSAVRGLDLCIRDGLIIKTW